MKKIKYVEQNEHSECGLSCIVMLLNYHDKNINLISLREKYGVPLGGHNLKNLSNILQSFGLKNTAIRTSCSELNNKMLPCLAFWESNHFVIVEKISNKNYVIVDPSKGREKLSHETFSSKFKNVILFVQDVAEINIPIKKTKSYLKDFIINQIRNNKIKYFLIVMLSLILQGISLAFSLLTRTLIDQGSFTNDSYTIILFFLVFFLYFIVQISRNYFIETLKLKFNLKINKDYVKKIVSLPLSFFVNRKSGEIMYRYNLINYIQKILDTHLLKTSIDIIFSLLYLIIMYLLSPHLTMVTVLVSMVVLAFTVINNKYLLRVNNKKMHLQSSSQSSFLELLNGIETIKSIGIEQNFYRSWNKSFSEFQDVSYKSNLVDSLFSSIIETLQFALPFFIIVLGGMLQEAYNISWGTIVSFSTLAITFVQPISELATIGGETLIVNSYIKKIDEILIQNNHFSSNKQFVEFDKIDSVDLVNVNFSYSFFEENVLNNIILSIKNGEKIAVVGPSGAGKSSLLKIISGLYNKTSGEVLINTNNELGNINYSSYNREVLYVPQTTTIFNMTLLDNLLLNETSIDNDYLSNVLRDTSLDQLIALLPQKEMTKISEDGMNLSGGQKQKIAIARALLRKPQLLLLDESTSSLDNISEKHILSSLKKYDMGIVFISHRLSTISNFEKIVVMDKGNIKGYGTHEELLKSNEVYSSLYKI